MHEPDGADDTERRPIRDVGVRAAWTTAWEHLVVEHALASVKADAIFCFGSRHWRVAERAARLHADGLAPIVLVTGGAASPDAATEADRLGHDIVARGVPATSLLRETRARNTRENVQLGVQHLRRHRDVRRLVIVSWPLASRRCLATLAHHEPALEVLSAPALPRPGFRWWPTRRRIRFALGELDRLERYAAAGHLVPPEASADLASAERTLRDWMARNDDQRTTRRAARS